jgi:hypothetical protein
MERNPKITNLQQHSDGMICFDVGERMVVINLEGDGFGIIVDSYIGDDHEQTATLWWEE